MKKGDLYFEIGRRVKAFRKERGISQEELADGICSTSTISLLENGQHFPSIEIVTKLADRLAVPIREIVMDQESDLKAHIQMDLIKVYVQRGEYEVAMIRLGEIGQQDELYEYQKSQLQLYRAECLMHTGASDQAVQELSVLLEKLERQRDPDDQLLANVSNTLGNAYYLSHEFVKAYAAYQRAYQFSQRFPFTHLSADIAFNIGMICSIMQWQKDAIEYYSISKDYYEHIDDQKKLADTFFNLALVHKRRNELELTAQYLQQAMILYEAENMSKRAHFAKQEFAYHVLSETKPEQAIQQLYQSVEAFDQMNDLPRLAYANTRLANVLLTENRVDEAAKIVRQSLHLLSQKQETKSPQHAMTYQVYARYLLIVQDYDRCIQFANESSSVFDEIGLLHDAAESMQIVVEAYEKQGEYKNAYEVQRQVLDRLRISSVKHSHEGEIFQ